MRLRRRAHIFMAFADAVIDLETASLVGRDLEQG
jgi:hypothetical protein